jgi:hypothetical protein
MTKKTKTVAIQENFLSDDRLPTNPLDHVRSDDAIQRRIVTGVLESYNSNYDVLGEMIQNAVDTLEDAFLLELKPPFKIQVHVNLKENAISVLDTGLGMTRSQAVSAFAPSVSFKNDIGLLKKRGSKFSYRGYKGVGLTFLGYGTDDIILHTKSRDGQLTKGRMQYARSWAHGERNDPALIVEDQEPSPIDAQARGTYIRVQLSQNTRPKRLSAIATEPKMWEAILRTRTAIGQVFLNQTPSFNIETRLLVTDQDGIIHETEFEPTFLLPHLTNRQPPFRFLDIPSYYQKHNEQTTIPVDSRRQDGIYLMWDTARIEQELTKPQKELFKTELQSYVPVLYAFLPYQTSIWNEINQSVAGVKSKQLMGPGLIIAVNRQRLADTFELVPSRYEALSRNLLVVIHFENARPDQGRKTVQDEVLDLAKRTADRALQYIAEQREFLKPQGDAPTPGQREVEKNHGDWLFNVRQHEQQAPLHIPPVTFLSEPQNEQDVVGLFHQMSALGVFPGLKILATSQIRTYDSLVKFDCPATTTGLQYRSTDENPIGVSPYILGNKERFETRHLTLEFKNNLDGLIDELDDRESAKDFAHIDVCVCWGVVAESFKGHAVEEITTSNIDERRYPGVTHLLRRDGQAHVIQVVMLRDIVAMIKTSRIGLIGRTPEHEL